MKENNTKKPLIDVPLMISGLILAQWQHPVASSEALDLLNLAMCKVIAMTI
jgi:hypothetical protein